MDLSQVPYGTTFTLASEDYILQCEVRARFTDEKEVPYQIYARVVNAQNLVAIVELSNHDTYLYTLH